MSATAESRRPALIRARPERTLLVVHAERLDHDAVWARVQPIARALAEDQARVTFFVFPYRAEAAGADIGARVRELDRLGHEVAQHTHFYAGDSFLTDRKSDDLSDANVAACINRDSERLAAMGLEPRGFTAGAWQLPEAALQTLCELDFAYDCSARHPQPRDPEPNPHHRWLARVRTYDGGSGSLVLLPTSCSLGGWFKWGRRSLLTGPPGYQMVYLHDYDLLARRTRLLLAAFLGLRRGSLDVSAGELASEVLAARAPRGER